MLAFVRWLQQAAYGLYLRPGARRRRIAAGLYGAKTVFRAASWGCRWIGGDSKQCKPDSSEQDLYVEEFL